MNYTEKDIAFYASIGLPIPSEDPPDELSVDTLQQGDRVSTFFMVDAAGDRTLGKPPNTVRVSELPLPEILKG